VVEAAHSYGGLVFHDVTTIKHAKRALEAGVDGLILVCTGAGGHAGRLSPFAFVPEVRQFYDGCVILSGAIASGGAILAAQALGADLAYIGTRCLTHTSRSCCRRVLLVWTIWLTAKGATFASGLASLYSASSRSMRRSQVSRTSCGRAFRAGKLPTMPALHWASTSSGPLTMNIGAPITGRRRLSRSNGGRAITDPLFVRVAAS
jgi:hypothetical protein